MVCKGCGERMYGPTREYCKACKARLAASRPSEPLVEDSMDKQTETPVKELTREERLATFTMPPEKMRFVYNRSAEPWEHMFDGRVYELQPYEVKALPSAVAEHLRAHSIIPGTLRRSKKGGGTLEAERYVALGPGWMITGSVKVQDDYILQYVQAEPEPDFLVPTTTQPGQTLFDLKSLPNYVDRPNMRDPGKPTHAEIVRV